MRRSWLVALLLLACRAADPGPLLGSWHSDEALTLREVQSASLSPAQLNNLTRPGFFGRLELRFEVGRVYSLMEGDGLWMEYRVVDAGPGFVQLEYTDPVTGEMVQPKALFDGDLMRMPVRDLGFYEVFRRVEAEPCEGRGR